MVAVDHQIEFMTDPGADGFERFDVGAPIASMKADFKRFKAFG